MRRSFVLFLAVVLLFSVGCTSNPPGPAVSRPDGSGDPTGSGGSSEGRPDGAALVESVYWHMEIVEVYGDSALVINAEDGEGPGLSRMSIQDRAIHRAGEKESLSVDVLRPGMIVEVAGGPVAESYPAQFEAGSVGIVDNGSDLIGLYRQVIHEMWEADPGLNSGIKMLGLDFSNACLLSQEQEALEYLTAQDLGMGMAYVSGTWNELADQGYIDRENLYWEDGLFLSVEVTGEPGNSGLTFNAQKWRSGLGAIFYDNCKAERDRHGAWTYTVGQFGIA